MARRHRRPQRLGFGDALGRASETVRAGMECPQPAGTTGRQQEDARVLVEPLQRGHNHLQPPDTNPLRHSLSKGVVRSHHNIWQ